MSDLEAMLAVQELDSALDQLPHRSARLEERAAHTAVLAELRTAQAAADAATGVIDESTARIEQLESEEASRASKRERLQAQMKTVISSREADALTSELGVLARERSEADDEELELMDRVEAESAKLDEARSRVAELSAQAAATESALRAAEQELAAERSDLAARRAAAAAALGADELARYEQLRRSFGGVAISRLAGGRCGACHLDQSKAALDAIRTAPAGTAFECEQCGRLLVP